MPRIIDVNDYEDQVHRLTEYLIQVSSGNESAIFEDKSLEVYGTSGNIDRHPGALSRIMTEFIVFTEGRWDCVSSLNYVPWEVNHNEVLNKLVSLTGDTK